MSSRTTVARYLYLILFSAVFTVFVDGLTKVIVPAVYKEYTGRFGTARFVWDDDMIAKGNYSIFMYQKLNDSAPNYVASNRGCENAVYYQYIVEHYHDFPDIAVFVHAHPDQHNGNWMDLVRCTSANMSYFSINLPQGNKCRASFSAGGGWAKHGIWLEQCLRDTIRIAWGNVSTEELNRRLPPNKPIVLCTHCCQQFIVSRRMVHKRTLETWKQLQHILSIQNVCHAGEPDYENLYAFNASSRWRSGPEYPTLGIGESGQYSKSLGRVTQAVVSEHLAHVIFGHHPLELPDPTMDDFCYNFLPQDQCPGSPCERNSTIL